MAHGFREGGSAFGVRNLSSLECGICRVARNALSVEVDDDAVKHLVCLADELAVVPLALFGPCVSNFSAAVPAGTGTSVEPIKRASDLEFCAVNARVPMVDLPLPFWLD